MKNKRLNVRIDEELDKIITVLCWEIGVNKSELITYLLFERFFNLKKRIGSDVVEKLINELYQTEE